MRRQELTGVEGVRWVPDRPSGTGALVLAGSSGRVDSERARLLAAEGAVAESLRWFGGPGQHEGPWEIPLELFLERVQALAETCDRVVVVGTSFGAEAALLTGAHSPLVSAVVAFAPSDVIWAGGTAEGRVTSHWTLAGQPLPYVPFIEDWVPSEDPPAFLELYRQSRQRFSAQVKEAAIPAERIPEVLLVAGGEDKVWPSVLHSDAIAPAAGEVRPGNHPRDGRGRGSPSSPAWRSASGRRASHATGGQ